VNTGDVERIPDFISPDYVEIHDGVSYPVGIDGAKAHIVGVRQVYSGLHLTIEQQIAEREWVVSQVMARGTHVGEWMGIAPTREAVEFTCVNVDKVINGRIVGHCGAANMLGPMLKIGAVKVVGPKDTGA
jgi:predicted ester cyclase